MGSPRYFSSYKLTDGSLVNVQLLDTIGQEKFRSINEQYYKLADCCLLVFDITNRKSFEECKGYYNKSLREKCKKNIKVILLGNKTDLEDKRVVSSEEGANFALENDYIYIETSCFKNTNVANAFETLIELTNIEMRKNQKEKEKEGNIELRASKIYDKKKGKKKCC